MTGPRIAANILAADLACLGHEVAAAVRSGADRVHLDVMELGVRDVTVAPFVCRALRRVTRTPLEVHLLVKPAERLVAAFAEAGADLVVFHPEASDDVARTAACVREHGCKLGIALAAGTPLDVLDAVPGGADLVLVTGATEGSAGGRIAPRVARWIRALRERVTAGGADVRIAIDGGVDLENAAELVAAGADTLVVESARCRPAERVATIAALKRGSRQRAGPRRRRGAPRGHARHLPS
ncbi:MAG TPA: hypothetical protein VFL83_01405 [Anaeromyxobacter sp.]|nr:hypothetical protein [Anaeromyxobacter sp.]